MSYSQITHTELVGIGSKVRLPTPHQMFHVFLDCIYHILRFSAVQLLCPCSLTAGPAFRSIWSKGTNFHVHQPDAYRLR